ncbi:WXG100 family type VII secretion target [Streptomyces sp. NPDC093228]|uniref:WXG100 family type VII secretion target n=1 Tax=Streptomyces sp. NPDC093228 TaxID=3155070 RepID=UPI003424DAFE
MSTVDGGVFKGSDGVLYHATPEDLRRKAIDIRHTQGVVQGELDRLKSYVVGLELEWGGIAANTFQELMGEWDAFAAQLQHALLAIASGLEGTAGNYLLSEDSNLLNLRSVQLPPARLV